MKRLYQFIVCLWACLTMASCYNALMSHARIYWKYITGQTILVKACWKIFKQYYKEQTGRYTYRLSDFRYKQKSCSPKSKKGMRILMWYVLLNISSDEYCIKVYCCLSILPLHSLITWKVFLSYILRQINKLGTAENPANRYAVCYMWELPDCLF